MIPFIIIYAVFFALIAWYRFNLSLAIMFFLAPAYLIRFNIWHLPVTLLEIKIYIIFIVFTAKIIKEKKIASYFLFIKTQVGEYKYLFISSAVFIAAATISVFTSADAAAAAGEWKAFYVEPFLIFCVLIMTFGKMEKQKHTRIVNSLLSAVVLSGLFTSVFAIYQHFSGWMVPWDFWENKSTFRVTGWWGFPNGVGLYLAPIWPLAIYLARQSLICKVKIARRSLFVLSVLYIVFAPLAIFYAKSTGALVGLAAGMTLLLFFRKKGRLLAAAAITVFMVVILAVPEFSNIKNELLLQDRSGRIRIAMWGEAASFLSDNPVFGAGLASYKRKIIPYHTMVNGEGVEIFHHPHNIFLTMWVNLGLLGLVGFICILVWCYRIGFLNSKFVALNKFVLSSITVILAHGMVDSPYIKNDLALLFWLLPALLVIMKNYDRMSMDL